MRILSRFFCLLATLALCTEFALAGPVNINTADAETLARELVGVGPALAAAIIREREQNGPFESPEEITRVRGIGEQVLENNKENILVKDADSRGD